MKVLLATDGSKVAEEAAWFLAHLPHSERLELTVLSVVPSFELHGSREVIDWVKHNSELEKKRAAELCGRVERAFEGADATVEAVVVEGHPAKTIVEQAKSRGIELVVIGARGHSVIARILLGSVSDFVATHAHCSVLLVRPDNKPTEQHEGLKLCLAYDGSKHSLQATNAFESFIWGGRTHLDIVNVVPLPFSYSDVPIEIDTASIKDAMSEAVEEVSQDLSSHFAKIDQHVIEAAHVGDSLVRFTDQQQSNIIFIGDTGHGLLGRFLLGSVARYLLHHAKCCVWLSRNPAANA